jgi:argininosuccinate lyase
MKKMWTGCTDGVTDVKADELNSSIKFDKRFYKNDIEGSIAHAKMLAFKNIIGNDDAKTIIKGLEGILQDIDSGALIIDEKAEDIHMFVEAVLTERVGEVGKKLHTARSRNDQVALDVRLYLRDEIDILIDLLKSLILSPILSISGLSSNTALAYLSELGPVQASEAGKSDNFK